MATVRRQWQAVEQVQDQYLHYVGLKKERPFFRGEHALWLAVLERALQDIALWHGGRRKRQGRSAALSAPGHASPEIYQCAEDWVLGVTPEAGLVSFRAVCDHLGVEHELVQDFVDEVRAKRRTFVALNWGTGGTSLNNRMALPAKRRQKSALRVGRAGGMPAG